MDRREPEARVGEIYALVAVMGKSGMSRFAVCVDVIVFWLGSSTWMPTGLGCTFNTGTLQCR